VEERKMKEAEGKQEKTTDGHPKKSSNKVNYYDMQPRWNYDSMLNFFFIGAKKTCPQSIMS